MGSTSGISYLYNATFAGEGSATLFDGNFSASYSPLEGEQSVLLVYDPIGSDPPTGGAIFQNGNVPGDAAILEMLVTDAQGLRLSLNETTVPLSVIETLGDRQRVSGDISAFAGTEVRLGITSPFGNPNSSQVVVDAITFVVPEPGTLTMTMMGFLGLMVLMPYPVTNFRPSRRE